MDKKRIVRTIISIIMVIAVIIAFALYILNKKNINKIQEYNIIGTIIETKITIEEQYIILKDDNDNKVKINITENTTFKQELDLQEGDVIKINGDKKGDEINAILISR